jgi:hypothetical protein
MGFGYNWQNVNFFLSVGETPLNEYEDEDYSDEEGPLKERFIEALESYLEENPYCLWDYDDESSLLVATDSPGMRRGDWN